MDFGKACLMSSQEGRSQSSSKSPPFLAEEDGMIFNIVAMNCESVQRRKNTSHVVLLAAIKSSCDLW